MAFIHANGPCAASGENTKRRRSWNTNEKNKKV